MKKFLAPLLLFLWHICVLGAGVAAFHHGSDHAIFGNAKVLPACLFAGLIGGVVYCLRGIYMSFCVYKKWDDIWVVWHCVRPLVSAFCGGICYFFLLAGVFFLKDVEGADFSAYVYYASAFLAGYNVDKFLEKLESINATLFGVGKSRHARRSERE